MITWNLEAAADPLQSRFSTNFGVEPLYFYSKSDRDDVENRMEIDFLLSRSKTDRRANISPVEVKSGKRYSLVSLKKFRQKYARFVFTPYVVHCKDMKKEDGVVYLPLYMVPLLVAKGFCKDAD